MSKASQESPKCRRSTFVQLLYQHVLRRDGDTAGVQFHLAELAGGESRGAVLTHFSESPECQALVIGVIQGGIVYTA